jgi:hypothetical protein
MAIFRQWYYSLVWLVLSLLWLLVLKLKEELASCKANIMAMTIVGGWLTLSLTLLVDNQLLYIPLWIIFLPGAALFDAY